MADMKLSGEKEMKLVRTQNSWRIFDFSNIPGETKYFSSIVDEYDPALEKYRIWNIEIFKDMGFVLANDEEQLRATFQRRGRHIKGQRYSIKDIATSVHAYIFRSIDNGQSFEKIPIGKGVPKSINRIDHEFVVVVDHEDRWSSSIWVSHDYGKSWENIQTTSNNIILSLIGIVKKGHYIFELTEHHKDKDDKCYLVYSDDGGKHFYKLAEVFQKYYTRPLFVTLYQNKLFFVKDNQKLVSVDLDTQEVKNIELNITNKKHIFEIARDKESKKIYLTVYDYKKGSTDLDYSKRSIYYPLEKRKIPIPSYGKNQHYYVSGEYIGLLARVKGILMHSWTKDGKIWYYELLPDYVYGPYVNGVGVGYGQIWMKVEIYNSKIVSQKGAYLAIGKFKTRESK